MNLVVSAGVWLVAIVLLLASLPVLAGVLLFRGRGDPGRRLAGRIFHGLGALVARLVPYWDFGVEGAARIEPGRGCVAVCNHESDADVFLVALLPHDLKWLSKVSIYRLPVMGWAMRLAGDVPVVRGDRESGAAALDSCRVWLERGVSVVIFPEGTRSRSLELLPFREGAFRLAVDTGAPILPLVLAGTREAMPPGSILFRPARARLKVLEPFETRGLGEADVPALADRVRARMAEARAALRAELGLPAAESPATAPPRRA